MSLLENLKNWFGFGSPGSRPTATLTTESPLPDKPVAAHPVPAPAGPPPAAQRREQLIRFIVSKLRIYQNEPDTVPVGIRLGILSSDPEEQALYKVALWASQPGKFQQELSRQLADNYITLPKNWLFDYTFFADELPASTYRDGNISLFIVDSSKPDDTPVLGKLITLVGQTRQPEYLLDPTRQTSFCIGRGQTTQTNSGRVRTNDIVIVNDDDPDFDAQRGKGNGAVSRAHASIRYDSVQRRYALLVDPGGLPASGNKTKIIHPDDTIERADIATLVYPLQSGDQIELGGEVLLLFELQ
ncbi:FHA domain-containing protein [Spirosoma sordidisoli]|uniref:FHA domain-containing protein n=1 Tax=Spirosoma sordidisoli TaxID=2502893 RepID=A0A4Q2UK26_9BACT|nr:FHA domain-containing protein [Spirosoma sordidisoli]RYC69857.1 FHA domain-containing protein [Spirosoma sordidisoli]